MHKVIRKKTSTISIGGFFANLLLLCLCPSFAYLVCGHVLSAKLLFKVGTEILLIKSRNFLQLAEYSRTIARTLSPMKSTHFWSATWVWLLPSVGSSLFALRPCFELLCTNMLSEIARRGPSTATCVDITTWKNIILLV